MAYMTRIKAAAKRCSQTRVMSATGLSVFDTTLQKTNTWLKELMRLLDWDDKQKAYLALRATLHALRDRLTIEETAQLAAQLPMLVRGFYYEGWDPTGEPVKDEEAFLDCIRDAFRDDYSVEPEPVARAVFALLASQISAGEIEDVQLILPAALRRLWPPV
jgi:uncharacterized protein (DUF2267 family)